MSNELQHGNASMSSRLRLTLVIALGLSAACGGGENPTSPDPGPDPDPSAASVSVSPSSDSVTALGDTTRFSAVVRDQNGDALPDVAVAWSSSDASVVSVGDDGEAVARANGTAEIVASAEGLADTAAITVAQEADQVSVSPAVDTVTAGDSLQLSAAAVDANGNAIAGAGFAWTTSDSAVATVDSTGKVRARADGSVEITAELDGVAGMASLAVEPAGSPPPPGPDGPPTVDAVSPSPLPEGGTATLSGSNFAGTAAGNAVRVDGVEATVVSATATTLEIDVPAFDCLPARDVAVEVETAQGTGSGAFPLDPDEAAVSLAAGQATRVGNPGDFCLQFGATGATERYLVGVQSASDAASSLTPVQITAEAAGGGGAALAAPLALSDRPRGAAGGGGTTLEIPGRLRAHRRAEMRLRREERSLWERGGLRPATSSPGPVVSRISVPPSTAAGDTVTVSVPDITSGALCTSFTEIGAEVKAVGTRGIVVADTANPPGFSDADYQDLSDRIDQDIMSTLESYFGTPTDIDGNGHVVAVFTEELNRTSPNTLGFVSSTDLSDPSSCASSNEGEYFYGKVPDPTGVHGSPYSVAEALDDAPFVMAHELTHVIQQTRRLLSGKPHIGSVTAEAQATLGQEVVGHAVTGRQPGQNYGAAVAANSDGSDEIDWYVSGFSDLAVYFGFESPTTSVADAPEECGWWRPDPAPCIGRSLWYGVGWSFLRWVTDQFGPSYPGGRTGLHRDLVDGSDDGLVTLEALVGEPLESLLADWAASLYVDDRISGVDPRLEITSWDLFDIVTNAFPGTARLAPLEQGFTDWTAAGEIRASSSAYVAVEDAGRPATAVRVRTGTGGILPADMQLWVVRLQ